MPTVILSKQFNFEPTVAQLAYDWFFPEEIQPPNPARGIEYNTFFTLASEPQLEMFPQSTILDDYLVFKALIDEWHVQRGTTSSLTEMVLCPAYQSIIGMGQKVIPLILTQLEAEGDDPDHWFWALQVLTRANPVRDEDQGNLARMSQAWLRWAASEGYAW